MQIWQMSEIRMECDTCKHKLLGKCQHTVPTYLLCVSENIFSSKLSADTDRDDVDRKF